MSRILVLGGVSRSLINFRGPLIREMIIHGHEVFTCAGEVDEKAILTLRSWGVRFLPINIARAGINPLKDLFAFFSYVNIIRSIKPDLILAYTIKPVIWGGLAARVSGRRNVYSLITGLGYSFIGDKSAKGRLVGWIARILYKVSIAFSHKVIFQNPDDQMEFISRGIVSREKSVVVSGSGVDTEYYSCNKRQSLFPENIEIMDNISNEIVFLMISRLIKDKGINEYIEAAKIIGNRCQQTPPKTSDPENPISPSQFQMKKKLKNGLPRFLLVGAIDDNPTSVKKADLKRWINDGVIEYLGELDDVRSAIEKSTVYVLPSYREGMPRTILEAMAMCKPIITTDVPGCRETIKIKENGNKQKELSKETIKYGINGVLVPSRNSNALSIAMDYFIDHPSILKKMGNESRRYVEERFDVRIINNMMLDIMELK